MLPNHTNRALPLLAALLALAPVPLAAQVGDTTARSTAEPAREPLGFSGRLFGSYGITPSIIEAQQPGQTDNAFVVEHAYLTFRMPAGERTSVRITADVYQTTDSATNAYTIRAKYAYLQYTWPALASGATVQGRIGVLQNVLVESQEAFWPRYLSQGAIERAGYLSSADAGLSSLVTLPGRRGEVYATITNGPGYASRERDRFKDFGLRLTLTPLAERVTAPLLQSLTVTAWGYRGAQASRFVNGGPEQVGNVGAALDRSRAGLFVVIRDPRLTVAGEVARRHDDVEQGANTVVAPRTVGATTGRLLSGFVVARPLAFRNADGRSSVGIVARYDRVSPSASSTDLVPEPSSDNRYHNLIAGVFWDLRSRAQLALDYQESLAASNDVSVAPVPLRGYFLHFNVTY